MTKSRSGFVDPLLVHLVEVETTGGSLSRLSTRVESDLYTPVTRPHQTTVESESLFPLGTDEWGPRSV